MPRRHPIHIAAQRVDLAIVRDHPVGMRQRPGGKSIRGEALVHERERRLEVLVVQVGIIGLELVGQEHALVDDRPAGNRDGIIAGQPALLARVDRMRDRFAQDVEATLELVLALDLLAAADEHLEMDRLERAAVRALAERGAVVRDRDHRTRATHRRVVARGEIRQRRRAVEDPHGAGIDRHGVVRQAEAEARRFFGEQFVRDLHQNSRAIAGARIGAHGAAMLEVAQDGERILDELVRFASFDVGDEADPAGILIERRIVETLCERHAGIGG